MGKKANKNRSEEKINNYIDQSAESDKGLSKLEKSRRKIVVRQIKKIFRAIDILFATAQNSCPHVKKDDAENLIAENDIVYDESLSDVCRLDFYRDKSEQKQPAIIIIHGGGFTAGDKKFRKGRAQFFAINGFSVFCINYGLAPDFLYPDPLKHIVSAVNYVYDSADRFNIDVNKIFVDGDSAGAYYAAMVSVINSSEKLKTILGCAPKFKFFGALLNCGVYDLDSALDKNSIMYRFADGVILSLTGIHAKDLDKYEYRDCCAPIDFVTSNFPPCFLIYSDNDIFCNGQGNIMVDKLNKNSVYLEYFSARYHGSNHCFSLTWSGDDAAAANELTLSFAKRLAADKIKF